jgi:GT2 family glycosyltransferase/2-polyprenyl-3-methyl-5-hydroxy-6-metoxy-1,4-benzoquinol methylase
MIPERSLNAKRYEPLLIDLENKNSAHALVIGLTGCNRVVLEVGTSTGYLSKLLKKRGNRIVGIEMDPEAAQVAQNYCETMILGDVESLDLEENLKNFSFDVILLADVLEHLRLPGDILRKLKPFLRRDGYLVVSLPNVGHGDILLNLFLGKFPYASKGLLDLTHVRFFTLEETLSLFKEAGYTVADLHTTTVPVGETEVPLAITDIAPEIVSFVRALPYANIYQFVFRAYRDDGGVVPNQTLLPKIQIDNFHLPKNDHIARIEKIIEDQRKELLAIHKTRGWKALETYRRWRDRFYSSKGAELGNLPKLFSTARMIFRSIKMTWVFAKEQGLKGAVLKVVAKLYQIPNQIPFDIRDEQDHLSSKESVRNPAVDIIIVTFNSHQVISKCLLSLSDSDYKYIRHIIVVDNHSTDRTLEILRNLPKFPIPMTIVENRENAGFGKAVNLGSTQVQSEFFVVLNPDAILYRDTLTNLMETMSRFGDLCGAVEPRQMPYEHPKLYNPVSMEATWFSGCCVLMRKKAFEAVKGFDENIFLYGEDVDLSIRLKMAGYSVKYCPHALVYHELDPHEARPHQKLFGMLSNLYLRGKFRQKIGSWFFLIMGALIHKDHSLPPLHKIFLYWKMGRRNRLPDRLNLAPYFPRLGSGYEVVRRRGHDVPLGEFAHSLLVSVIVRTHNRPELLNRVLANLSRQTYKNVEIIVVEDRTQTAGPVVEKYAGFLNIRYLRFSGETGRTGAINLGLKEACGEWIFLLDDDDVIFADTLETLLYHIVKTSRSVAYGGALELLTDDKWQGLLQPSYCHPFTREKLQKENFIPIGSFLFRRSLLDSVGYFDERLQMLEDWDFLRRMSQKTEFLFVPKDFLIFLTPLDPTQRLLRQVKLDAAHPLVSNKQ